MVARNFQLLFRALEYSFSASEFDKWCDGVNNTLVIVKTEFNKVIGGFTPNRWQSDQGWECINDQTGKAFLFSLALKEKYEFIDPETSIQYHKSYGPVFGAGADLCLFNNAHESS